MIAAVLCVNAAANSESWDLCSMCVYSWIPAEMMLYLSLVMVYLFLSLTPVLSATILHGLML